jgi:hypothetical protein
VPTVKDVLEHVKFLIEKGRADEKAVLVLPRVESQKRRLNKEKKNRIVMVVDPEFFSEWNTWHEAYMLTCGENPVLARQAIIEAMKAFDVKGYYESRMKDQSDEAENV